MEKAGLVKPGIYNLYLASQADKNKTHDGVILYADKESVFQQVGKSFIKHARSDFDKVPEGGSNASIRYDQGRAVASVLAAHLSRGLSRCCLLYTSRCV